MSSKPLSSIVSCCDVGPPGKNQTNIYIIMISPATSYNKLHKNELIPGMIQLYSFVHAALHLHILINSMILLDHQLASAILTH
jgi:hypothetical protein